MPLNAISPEHLGVVGKRLTAIRPLLEFRAAKAEGKRTIVLFLSEEGEISTFERLVEYRARQVRVSSRTLYRWCARFTRSGERGLADRRRRDKGVSISFRNRSLAVALVSMKHAQGSSVDEIHRVLSEQWPLLYPGSRVPCKASVRFLIRSICSSGKGRSDQVRP